MAKVCDILLIFPFFVMTTDVCVFAGYVNPEGDGGLEQDLASRRYRALMPDHEDYSDDDF